MTSTPPDGRPGASLPAEAAGAPFTPEQKEYLAGFLAALAQRQPAPAGGTAPGSTIRPEGSGAEPPNPVEETLFGTPLSECTKQELWKRELHGLDAWDRLLEHASENKFPDEADTFRFRFHGLFFVGPAQNSFMLRCRIPAGELTAAQLHGLADLADEFGNRKAAITTRSNIQIREIAPRHLVSIVTRLQSLGLTAKGSGVDNVRNITASPTAGFDPQELIDTRPFAHALHHYILNHRDLYDLPRKFNVAFEGGGLVDTVADTNDIGFMAVRVPRATHGVSLKDGASVALEPGVYFRVELCGITGHRQLAADTSLAVKPAEAVPLAAAMLRVFLRNSDRTDRKKARLKYLVDRWGLDRFLSQTQKLLSFPLVRLPLDQCQLRRPALKHGHIGVYREKEHARNYIGVVVPVGVMTTKQMRRVADLAANYGSGQLRLTPWQNLLILGVTDAFVETVKRQLVRCGLHYEASAVAGGLVACTGNTGCKWASTDTKSHAVALAKYLQDRVRLDEPVNIHFTGCPNSCAQHYVGDIGLQGVRTNFGGASVEAYHIVLGGGTGAHAGIGRQIFTAIPFSQVPALVERVLRTYIARRHSGESFAAFSRRHDLKILQEMFSEDQS